MNPEQRIWEVAKMFFEAVKKTGKKVHLCYWEKKLQVLPFDHTQKPHMVFRTVDALDVDRGMTSAEWNKLKLKLENFFKDKR